jgi:hypothetical protein
MVLKYCLFILGRISEWKGESMDKDIHMARANYGWNPFILKYAI